MSQLRPGGEAPSRRGGETPQGRGDTFTEGGRFCRVSKNQETRPENQYIFGVHALRFSDVDCFTESAIISSCRLEVARDKEERLRLEEEETLRKEEETLSQKEGGLAGPENLCFVTMRCL